MGLPLIKTLMGMGREIMLIGFDIQELNRSQLRMMYLISHENLSVMTTEDLVNWTIFFSSKQSVNRHLSDNLINWVGGIRKLLRFY